jgi:hypothetical protein
VATLLSHLFSVCLGEHHIIVLPCAGLCCGWLAAVAEGLELGLSWYLFGALKRCSNPWIGS